MEAWNRVKAHPFWYGAGAILIALVPIFDYEIRNGLLSLGKWFLCLLASMWGWLWDSQSISLPGWLWVIAGVVSVVGLIGTGLLVLAATSGSNESAGSPAQPTFVEMRFKNANWRWGWVMHSGLWEATNISSFCPVCDRMLVHYCDYTSEVVFVCEGCREQGLPGDRIERPKEIARIQGIIVDAAIDVVKREIHYRARQMDKHQPHTQDS